MPDFSIEFLRHLKVLEECDKLRAKLDIAMKALIYLQTHLDEDGDFATQALEDIAKLKV